MQKNNQEEAQVKRSRHVYSTMALIVLLLLAGATTIINAFGNSDLDTLCDTNGNYLLRVGDVWGCGPNSSINSSSYWDNLDSPTAITTLGPLTGLNVTGNTTLAFPNVVEGSSGRMGLAQLSGGVANVTSTAVTANSRIFLTAEDGTLNIGVVWVSARNPGRDFLISSNNVLDARSVAWLILEPAAGP